MARRRAMRGPSSSRMDAWCLPDHRAATILRRRSPRPPVMRCAAATLIVLVAASAARVVAQPPRAFQPPAGPTPHLASGHVDFSGVWSKPYVPDMTKDGTDQKGMAVLPFTPWGDAEWKKYDAAEGDYTGSCLPF